MRKDQCQYPAILTEEPNAVYCNNLKDSRYDIMLWPYVPAGAKSSDDDDDDNDDDDMAYSYNCFLQEAIG